MRIFGWKLVNTRSGGYSPPDLAAMELALATVVEDIRTLRVQLSRVEKKVYRDKPSQRFEPSDDGHEPQVPPVPDAAQQMQSLRSGDPPPAWMM